MVAKTAFLHQGRESVPDTGLILLPRWVASRTAREGFFALLRWPSVYKDTIISF